MHTHTTLKMTTHTTLEVLKQPTIGDLPENEYSDSPCIDTETAHYGTVQDGNIINETST